MDADERKNSAPGAGTYQFAATALVPLYPVSSPSISSSASAREAAVELQRGTGTRASHSVACDAREDRVHRLALGCTGPPRHPDRHVRYAGRQKRRGQGWNLEGVAGSPGRRGSRG